MNELQKSLSKCSVKNNVVFLPKEPLANYPAVKKALLDAGGKYNKNTFIFPTDAQPYMDKLIGGETVNLKKDFQFYPTPVKLAKYLVDIAQPKENERVLEPSAGQGALINAIMEKRGHAAPVYYCELMEINRNVLSKIDNTIFLEEDFLQIDVSKHTFDCIIANPPFQKNQDISHIRKMYDICKKGGRIVSFASTHWEITENKKEVEFREWLTKIGAKIEYVAAGEFKESGTNVKTCIITINKR